MPETTFEHTRYDVHVDRVARIMLTRPEKRNAQDCRMLHEIDHAFQQATPDDDIRLTVLVADGPHVSSGHDLTSSASGADFKPQGQDRSTAGLASGNITMHATRTTACVRRAGTDRSGFRRP
ncbi:enoyl-CoA hydratase-related protein [Streptomyces asiaticus]|uniref:enoyl-CoA hydratase-related protein n=1 Tax=Streptomyces asiaticus TaxID=114695 RepID=UPI003D73F5CB